MAKKPASMKAGDLAKAIRAVFGKAGAKGDQGCIAACQDAVDACLAGCGPDDVKCVQKCGKEGRKCVKNCKGGEAIVKALDALLGG